MYTVTVTSPRFDRALRHARHMVRFGREVIRTQAYIRSRRDVVGGYEIVVTFRTSDPGKIDLIRQQFGVVSIDLTEWDMRPR